jgi:hypothetical protein
MTVWMTSCTEINLDGDIAHARGKSAFDEKNKHGAQLLDCGKECKIAPV